MLLVDTSVWVDHFRHGNARFAELLDAGQVLCHPFIIGELACGNTGNRRQILSLLQDLPSAKLAGHNEVMRLIEDRRLMARGLGYIDVHLLASALLSEAGLWTVDRRLRQAATEITSR